MVQISIHFLMDHDLARLQQQDLLDRTIGILGSDPRVLGLALTGSFAQGRQDAFSDIDLTCWLRDEERTGRENLYRAIANLATTGSPSGSSYAEAPTAVSPAAGSPTEGSPTERSPTLWHAWLYDLHALYLFENGVRLDVDFCRPSQIEELLTLRSEIKIVYDPEGALAAVTAKIAPTSDRVVPAKHPPYFQVGDQSLVDWFFWMFRQIVCWAQRSAQGGPSTYEKLANTVDSLAQVRSRLVEIRLWTLGVDGYLKRLDPAFAQRLAHTYPRFDAAEVIRCAEALLDEYERVLPPYCEKSGASYPVDKVRTMRSLMDSFGGLGD